MKQLNITIHPFSALAGMALLGLVLVTAGAMPLQGSSSTRDVSAIEDVNSPRAANAVAVYQGVPYTVPSSKLLIVTGIGLTTGQVTVVFALFDGATVLGAEAGMAGPGGDSVAHIPFGLVANGGQVVTASASAGSGVVLGYLVDA